MRGTAWVSFEEELDSSAPLRCIEPVCAALYAGFQLVQGMGNVEHAYTGAITHPRQFKDAKRSRIRRFIALRFVAGSVTWQGGVFRVEQFIEAWVRDGAMQRDFQRRPKWDESCAKLNAKIRAAEPVVKAGYDERRQILIPIRGGTQAELRARLLHRYEEG